MSLSINQLKPCSALALRAAPRSRASMAHSERLLVSLTFALAFSWGAHAFPQEANKAQTLEGRLISVKGTGPMLKTGTKNYRLGGRTTYLFHTLEDKRLLNREVHLEGAPTPDGAFEVERIFTMHHGMLYRIRYFCETCNIQALEPGNCVCCQQPTELQEFPASAGADPKPQDITVLH
jgi:hypothetical protein